MHDVRCGSAGLRFLVQEHARLGGDHKSGGMNGLAGAFPGTAFGFFFFRYCGNSVPCCNLPLTAPIRGGRAGVARRLFQLEPSPSRPVTIGAIKTRILNVTQASLNANITSAVSPFLCTVVAHRLLVHEWWRFRIRTGGGVSIMTFWGSFVLRTSIFSGTKLYECNFLAPR